jgi:ABC-2 type transport system ATP-binding protein
MPLYAVKSDNLYQLKKDLNEYENTYSCYAFGEFLHLSFRKNDESTEMGALQYLKDKNHTGIELKITGPTIEDCFINRLTEKV